MGYTKHKEKSPQDTIFEIRQILNRAGIFTVLNHTSEEYEGAHSNRISLYPSKILGQNGKGTDELFATASGYAELMERIQNNALDQRLHTKELRGYASFWDFPDEKIITIDELLAQDDSYLNNIFQKLGYVFQWQRESFLETLAQKYYGRFDGTINVVPYVDVFSDRIIYLPLALIKLFALTNGMTAGNTLEEALVQGISEVYERHVNKILIRGGYTPPEIPREHFNRYGLNNLIEQIERGGKYKVSVRDCSLGKGYPVTATIIRDLEHGTFGIKFGCHPSLAISVERTLTEALQGKTIEKFTSNNKFGSRDEIEDYHNTFNVMKIGYGFFPPELLTGKPSWKFSVDTWEKWQSTTNGEYLKKLGAHVKAQGYSLMIRDSSHMGFKSYHVLIPEIHNIMDITETRVREFWTQLNVAESLNHFPNLTDEEERRLLKFIRFKESSVEGGMGLLFMHYFTDNLFTSLKIAAYLSLKRSEYSEAEKYFRQLTAIDADKNYFLCLADFSKLMAQGLTVEDAHEKIKYLYREDTARRVVDETADLDKVLTKVFPQMKCFDCENCALAGIHCEYPRVNEIYRKIKTAMKDSKVSQEILASDLKRVI